MEKTKLHDVTLIGVDCLDLKRIQLAAHICQENFDFSEVKILSSLSDPHYQNLVKIDRIGSVEEYSQFILEKLDDYFTTSHVLIIQYDGFILNPNKWDDDFLNYDYIGAPWLVGDWAVNDFDFPKELLGKRVVGNGGFSLRSKKLTALCKELFRNGLLSRIHPEDVALCVYQRQLFENKGINFAPVGMAQQFSYEGEDNGHCAWTDQFGFHGLSYTDISRWAKQHPQYTIDNPAAD